MIGWGKIKLTSDVKNTQKTAKNDNVRVYDFDMLLEKKVSSSRNTSNSQKTETKNDQARIEYIKARCMQPKIADIPEKIELEKRAVLIEEHEKREKLRVVKAKGLERQSYVGFVITAIVCTMLFMFMMWTSAQINESTQAISSLQTQLTKLTEKEKELNLMLEMKNDLRVIEELATLEYGMVKTDNLTKQHVNINNEDKIEVSEPEEPEESVFSTVMSALGENFKNLLEYIY